MKILPVQNYNNYHYKSISKNYKSQPVSCPLASDTLSISKKNDKKNVSFSGNIQRTAITLAKQIPLEDRISALFDVFKRGDVITVGNNLKGVQKSLKDSLDSFDHVIKRVFFIEDDNIGGNLAFFKNATGDKEVLNINNFDIHLSSSPQGREALQPNNSFYIVPGDVVHIKDMAIPIKERPLTNLSLQRHIFSKVYDFTNESKDIIKRQNSKEVAALVKNTKSKGHPISFADVGGQDSVIDELKKGVLFPIKYPEAFEDVKVNHGIILTGPPGTGKTLIAEALANESNAHFTKLNGSELKSKWVGESEENLRNFFADAVDNQPSIVVFDEFDSVAKKRDKVDNHSAEFVNQFLSIMSDIEKNGDDVYVLATTNKVDMLDEAIMRSGRFGKHIEVGPPDLKGTRQILDIHTKSKPLDKNLDKEALSNQLHSIKATGADIARLVADAHNNAYQRLGIFEKMDAGTFRKSDIENLKIQPEDFNKAIKDFTSEKNVSTRKPIGYR